MPYTRLNADPRVMRYFPRVLSARESRAQMSRLQAFLVAHGWGVWAVTLKSTGEFIGMTGLHAVEKDSGIPHAPLTEIAWRMLPDHWGRGHAPEAARSVMQFAFEVLALDAVHAFTATVNGPSRRVMTKIGMVDTGEVFDHPALPAGHVLQRHCLYVMTRAQWERGMAG